MLIKLNLSVLFLIANIFVDESIVAPFIFLALISKLLFSEGILCYKLMY